MAHKLKTRLFKTVTLVSFFVTLACIVVLIVLPRDFWSPKRKEWKQSRLIVPQSAEGLRAAAADATERMDYASAALPLITLEDGEIQITAISEDFDADGADEQVIAYRNLLEKDNPIYLTFIDYDERSRSYIRLWSVKTAASRPGTVTLFTADLIGNHHPCVVLTGMNQNDEQTLTACRILPADERTGGEPGYRLIARLTADGSLIIQETERSQAYQMGFAQGASFNITARGRDPYSANNLDQIETTYSYDPIEGVYERSGSQRIAGAQIEANKLRELLNGGKQEFERFVDGLWYHVNAEGTIDNERYLYFDTANREVSFYSEDTQQVYGWQSSWATRSGLFISSQNISVTTLNRKIDIELESLDSIRVRVSEDVRMRIIMNAPWDGSYRRAKTARNAGRGGIIVLPAIDAAYTSPLGKMVLSRDGEYQLELNGAEHSGKYAFYKVGENEILEFVSLNDPKRKRTTYRVDRARGESPGALALARIRLGINGIYEFREPPVLLQGS